MLDKFIVEFDKIIKTLTTEASSVRAHPDEDVEESSHLTEADRKHSLGLMRIDHTGEICAQGLYQGQILTSRILVNKEALEHASKEEEEHLAWTKRRIDELGGRPSILNPLFYMQSLAIGMIAGSIGDKWNLGFLEETELQVEKHLEEHMFSISKDDKKSLAILNQMKIDERKHADMAHDFGAAKLPKPIKMMMKVSAKIMTKTTYYI